MTYSLPKITQWSFSLEVSNLRKFWTQTNTLVRLTAELTGFLRDLTYAGRQSGTETVFPCYLPLLAGFQSNPGLVSIFFEIFTETTLPMFLTAFLNYLGLKYKFNSNYIQWRVCPKFCSLSVFRKIVSFFPNPQFHFGQIPLRPKLEFLLYQYCQWLNYQRLSR